MGQDNRTDLPGHGDELEVAIHFVNQDSLGADPGSKITFDISTLDESGLYGSPDAKRALAYEFCIPATVENRTEVKRIDPTVKFFVLPEKRSVKPFSTKTSAVSSTFTTRIPRVTSPKIRKLTANRPGRSTAIFIS